MKQIIEHVNELATRLREDMPLTFDTGRADPEAVADWIIYNYKPPVEWEQGESDGWKTPITIRITIANEILEQRGSLTREVLRRKDQRAIDHQKKYLRSALGRQLMDLLDKEQL